MQNIWDFILQSLSLSLVAALILIVKRIFKDKLPPSWQYGVWGILALRALLPVRAEKFVILPFGFYLEWLKSSVELRLNSAYTEPYTATQISSFFPAVTDAPQSLTDKIFIFYVFGVIAFLMYYLFSYVRLKLTVRRGIKLSGEEADRINALFEKNKIRFVKIITLEGIDSAFICGVFRPVLVIPLGRTPDEKVIMHEIIHLKHFDSLQSIFWCVIRALHWCNPFMHIVLNTVGNDMESRCDQRVLEMLDGEERREYGILLLNEVNKKYARMPGTTSVSNGGKNIAKRIESIVRFKKYPKGMAIVSICIILVLAIPSFLVSANFTYNDSVFYPRNETEMQESLIYARLYRCETMAGAIDTFAKALYNQNGIMLLTASPEDKAEEITKGLKNCRYYDSGFTPLNNSECLVSRFALFNLIKTDKNRYSAILAFSIPREADEEEKLTKQNAEAGSVLVPIEVFKENGYWVVTETGERTVSDKFVDKVFFSQIDAYDGEIPPMDSETIKGENGTLERRLYTVFTFVYSDYAEESGIFAGINTDYDGMDYFFNGDNYDNRIYRNAKFGQCIAANEMHYTYEGENSEKVREVTQKSMTAEKGKPFPDEDNGFSGGSVGVNWDGVLNDDYYDYNKDPEKLKEEYCKRFKYEFFIDGELADEFVFEVNING